MDANYICLDGSEATMPSENYLQWRIHPSYFKDIENLDKIYISLVSCQFNGGYVTDHSSNLMLSAEVVTDINFQNNTKTNNQLNTLAIVSVNSDNVSQSTSCYGIQHSIPYRVNQFNKITLAVLFQGELLSFAVLDEENNINKDFCKFILKLEYKSGNNVSRTLP